MELQATTDTKSHFQTTFTKSERPPTKPLTNTDNQKPEKNTVHLPTLIKESTSQKNIKLAYSLSNDIHKKHILIEEPYSQRPELAAFVTKLQNVSVVPVSQRGVMANLKVQNKSTNVTNPVKKPRVRGRARPPKTQFKIMKSNENIDKLERVLVDFIDKNKLLRSSNDEIIMRPQNRMQAAINSLRAVNKILPKANIVGHTFGYDEANLTKNHLTLEKVMLERITKIKLRRQEEKFIKEQEEAAAAEQKAAL